MKQIQRTVLSSLTSNVVFDVSGVTGYRDLLLIIEAKNNRSSGSAGYNWIRVNGVGTAGNYFQYSIYALVSGTSLTVGSAGGAYHPTSNSGYSTGAWAGWAGQSPNNSSGSYSLGKVYIPNFAQSTLRKNLLTSSVITDVSDANPNYSMINASTYTSTAAITSLDVRAYDDTTYWSFEAGTVMTLFGLPELAV